MGPLVKPSEFWSFSAQVPAASRDKVGLDPIRPWGTQRYLIEQIQEGHAHGIHQHFVHKGRAVGASLILQQWTMFNLLEYPGLQAACIADDDENREYFRDTLTQMWLGVPRAPEFRLKNKNQLAWDNGSKLLFQFAGIRERKLKKLGVGRGLSFLHATEAPLWVTSKTLTYLRSAFSKEHPARCFVFEGTPRGKGDWYEMWKAADAGDLVEAQAIFLGWWRREDYALATDSDAFRRYWDGRLSPRERHWTRHLQRRYQIEVRPEQWAWRRWYVAEEAGGDERVADQEMATLPEEAFEATGISFLSVEAVRRSRRSVASGPTAQYWRYDFGAQIENTKVRRTTPAHAMLHVWEEPELATAYVVAAVPAYSTNPECPTAVVGVFKASRDALIQVAEFSDTESGMQPFAWVCAHLLGVYASPKRAFILETAGVGIGTLQELKGLQGSGWGTSHRPVVSDMVGGVRHYIYRRADSLMGSGGALQWKMTPELRAVLFTRLRDQLGNGAVQLRSEDTQRELERIRQEGDEFRPEGRDAEEHRVVTVALAVESWRTQLRPIFERVQGTQAATTVTGRMVGQFFERLRAAAK